MSQTTLAALRASFEELPFHQLIDLDIDTLDDDSKRVLVEVLQERRQSAQKRRSVAKKQAKKITGKSEEVDISRFM